MLLRLKYCASIEIELIAFVSTPVGRGQRTRTAVERIRALHDQPIYSTCVADYDRESTPTYIFAQRRAHFRALTVLRLIK